MKYIRYPEDCLRIQKLCLSHKWDVSLAEANAMWETYSASMCAGWMILPESDNILWQVIEPEMETLLGGEAENG